MNKIHICRKHNLDHEQCRTVAKDLLGKLVDQYGGSLIPDGENFSYRHTSGMKAVVEPREGELDIKVKLNFMTMAFAPEIKRQINQVLDKYISEDLES